MSNITPQGRVQYTDRDGDILTSWRYRESGFTLAVNGDLNDELRRVSVDWTDWDELVADINTLRGDGSVVAPVPAEFVLADAAALLSAMGHGDLAYTLLKMSIEEKK